MVTNVNLPAMSVDSFTGKVGGDSVAKNTNNNWKIAEAYRIARSFPIVIIYPRDAEAHPNSFFKWATPDAVYDVRPSWQGGEAPFRLTLVNAPAGAYVGNTGLEQTYTRAQDEDIPSMYVHSLPENYARVRCQFDEADLGSTKRFRLMIEDNSGRVEYVNWFVKVERRHIWFDATLGNDANSGTFESPKKTIAHGYGVAGNDKIFMFKSGTYFVDSSFSLNSTKCKSYVGVGEVTFDMNAGTFGNDANDTHFSGITFDGAKSEVSNVRLMWFDRATRFNVTRCIFNPTSYGTSGGDNPSCIFITDHGSGGSAIFKQYLSITDTTLASTAKVQLIGWFDIKYAIIENCWSESTVLNNPNGPYFLHPKDACSHFTIRHCGVKDFSSNLGAIAFSNQDGVNCNYQEIVHCAIQSNAGFGIRWNAQTGDKGENYNLMRCTLSTGESSPLNNASQGDGGELYVSGVLYASTAENFNAKVGGEGTTYFGEPISQTAAANILPDFRYSSAIKPENLGKTGHLIASTLVN